MKAFRILLLPALLLTVSLLCASPAVAQDSGGGDEVGADTTSALLNEYDLEYELVFQAVKDGLSKLGYDVTYASKHKHLIETSFKILAHEDDFWDVMKQYGEIPFKRSPRWTVGRAKISVRLEELDGKTSIKISSILSGYESRFDNTWLYWPSNGKLEQQALDAINDAVDKYNIP